MANLQPKHVKLLAALKSAAPSGLSLVELSNKTAIKQVQANTAVFSMKTGRLVSSKVVGGKDHFFITGLGINEYEQHTSTAA